MQVAKHWKDFEVLDAGEGEKLERWGRVVLRRPDPQAIWPRTQKGRIWEQVDAVYHRSATGGGRWEQKRPVPNRWSIAYRHLQFHIEPTGFKHTGLFPEQAVNWDWMQDLVKKERRAIRVLNLFAYTGGATVALAEAGAEVCHVDAAKRMVGRAKENATLSGLQSRPIRFITDDVMKFIQREVRRGNQYEGIVMDPPSYGRGPTGELWKIEDTLFDLIAACAELLSRSPLFFLVNSYTTGLSPSVASNMLKALVQGPRGGSVTSDEIGLPISGSELVLPCGAFGRWEADAKGHG